MVKRVRLGRSDINVFPIALGTNVVGSHNLYPNLNEEQGREVIHQAIDNGIAPSDTVYICGSERSEELVGQVVKEYPREKVQIATEGSHVIKEGEEVIQNSDPKYLKQQVENSLERLQVDYIDLYYIRFPDGDTPKDRAVAVLKELKDEGKTKAIGVSNFSLEQLKGANKDGYVDVAQLEYNLLHHENEEVMAYVAEGNIIFVPYFPLTSGILAGKYDENRIFEDHRAERPSFQPDVFKDNAHRVKALTDIAEAHDTTIANVVLASYLTRPSLDIIIPSARRAEQVVENIDAVNIELSQGEIDEVDSLFPVKK